MPLGEVIEKFLAAKSNRSSAYMDKLNADTRLFRRAESTASKALRTLKDKRESRALSYEL